MREVEPQRCEPHEVEHHVIPLREGVGDQRGAVRGRVAQRVGVVAHELHELHLGPEVGQVQTQAGQHDEAQHEHVLRSPRHAGLLHRHGVALRAARLVVVERQHHGVDQVHEHAGGEHGRAHERIPVGTQERTDQVIPLGREDRRDVHGHVEEDKEHQECTRDAHY